MTISDLIELQTLAFEVVHDPARCADDDLRAGLQALELALVRLAAVDWQFAHAALEERELGNLFRDLDGELARRAKDQDLGRAHAGIDQLDRWNPERGRLAGTGLRLPDDIGACQ